ncbi:MAG: sulfur carrier protein ThiS [Planctomycetaceae bacterium]
MPESITIHVNGEQRSIQATTTLAELLESLKLNPKFLAVECNLAVVPRTTHAQHRLNDGDVLEIVTLVGGG